MDEEDYDLQSPIGQIIKNINNLCKKPRIDNQLNEALELFNNHIIEQQQYLRNGIFKTNFAEAALFLQSCSELYGKKIDLLWDEMIAFLTRLIQYDCEHDKEQGKEVNQEVIFKLEERRNKFKRKRKSKKDEEAKKLAEQLLSKNVEVEQNVVTEGHIISDNNICNDNLINDNMDATLPDTSDITEIPGWNNIQCLFEQMDERKLPDKNNLLAILKVCAYGRMQFLKGKNLPLNTSYSAFKNEYLIFRKKFFEDAAKTWGNLTIDAFEDLHKVLTYLAQKERQAQAKPTTISEVDHLPQIIVNSSADSVDKCLENSDDDSLFELSFITDENNKSDTNDLFIHLEQLPSDVINNKLRQDSGFYEFNSDDSYNSDDENKIKGTGLTLENPREFNQNGDIDYAVQIAPKEINSLCGTNESNIEENKENQQPTEENLESNQPDDNFDTMSDHDYCAQPITVHNLVKQSRKRKNNEEQANHLQAMQLNCFGCKYKSTVEKLDEKEKKKRVIDELMMPPPLKIRKLSHKQIVKLLQSVIPAVKENQFEMFFSKNYQPEEGEGGIQTMRYQSDHEYEEDQSYESDENSSDEENEEFSEDQVEDNLHDAEDDQECLIENMLPITDICLDKENLTLAESIDGVVNCENVQNNEKNIEVLENRQQTAEDLDDTLSIFSEHSYCQTTDCMKNDSGFVDSTSIPEEEQEEENMESLFRRVDNIVGTNNDPVSIDEEYQRILHLLDESQKDMINEQAGRPTEAQRKEQEALELKARVQEWEELISPVLKELDGQDFDIHEYGTKIMDQIPTNETKSFSTMVQGMSSAEVTRYFISSLQLANTDNIEICGARPGQLSNESFEIRLLHRDRYHERLTEYQAPSKESLKERLTRLKNRKKVSNTYEESPPSKRNKTELLNGINNNTTTLRTKHYSEASTSQETIMASERTLLFRDSSNTELLNEINNSTTLRTIDYSKPSTSQEALRATERTLLFRDSNNNPNRNRECISLNNNLSKSFIDNPKKGKSIMRKSFISHHVSFEGSQAPQALSVQITSPRQLHTVTSLPNWTQSSTSYGDVPDRSEFLDDETMFENHTIEKDFQRLHDMQRLHSSCQMQSTPRTIVTTPSMFTTNINRKKLFD